jgi:hypothetical protein
VLCAFIFFISSKLPSELATRRHINRTTVRVVVFEVSTIKTKKKYIASVIVTQ